MYQQICDREDHPIATRNPQCSYNPRPHLPILLCLARECRHWKPYEQSSIWSLCPSRSGQGDHRWSNLRRQGVLIFLSSCPNLGCRLPSPYSCQRFTFGGMFVFRHPNGRIFWDMEATMQVRVAIGAMMKDMPERKFSCMLVGNTRNRWRGWQYGKFGTRSRCGCGG